MKSKLLSKANTLFDLADPFKLSILERQRMFKNLISLNILCWKRLVCFFSKSE